MYRAALLLLALVLTTAVHAQAQASPAAPASAPPPAAPGPRLYTGLDLSFSATVGPNMVQVMDFPLVKAVDRGSPGQQAGIVGGDRITEVNGRDSREPTALRMEPGVRYTLRIRRGEEELEVVLVPAPPRDPAPRP